ncbi:MAG: hypothetical protein GY851_27295 [bacterium]|nr:hypothetical protein [bacterium]
MTDTLWTASKWLHALATPTGPLRETMLQVYGTDADTLADRTTLLRQVVERFITRFGDLPVRIIRCPGRINLRGMHVDTHGGYINLMTHQREVVLAISPTSAPEITMANIDPEFDEVAFDTAQAAQRLHDHSDWMSFITSPTTTADVGATRGHWEHYVRGSALATCWHTGNAPRSGAVGVIGSDIPRGAALSSSAALCVSLVHGLSTLAGNPIEGNRLIVAGRDAEWYTGSRCGLSDQAAMVLGGRDETVNVLLKPEGTSGLDTSSARHIPFPCDVGIVVANSLTERSLSGAEQVEYTRNRFAYSLALEILRQEMAAQNHDAPAGPGALRLSDVSDEKLESMGGVQAIYKLLIQVPEEASIHALRKRYELPGLDASYDQYFGNVPDDMRPSTIGLRGPLLYGLAESERARLFPDLLERGLFKRAGVLMTRGHDGDRRIEDTGATYTYRTDDDAIEALMHRGTPLALCAGAYGASSAVLDMLVDAALEAGALGASLTGAGIAGSVIAMCRADETDAICAAIRACMASDPYAAAAGWDGPATDDKLEQVAVVNHTTASVCELTPFA